MEIPITGQNSRTVGLHSVPDSGPFFVPNTPGLRATIERAFKRIEELDEEIAERRNDIKEVKRGLTDMGLAKKGVDLALARRRLLLEKGGLKNTDETLMVICRIGSLGIQGELFADGPSDEGGNGAA